MKKTIKLAFIACLILLMSALILTACGSGTPNPPVDTTSSTDEQTTPMDMDTTAPEDVDTTAPEDVDTTVPKDEETDENLEKEDESGGDEE